MNHNIEKAMENFYWPVRHGNRHNTDYIPIDGHENLQIQKKILKNIPASTVAVYDKQCNFFLSTLNRTSHEKGTLWSFDVNGDYRWHSELPNPSLTSPGLDSEGNIFICDGIYLYKFSNHGEIIWNVKSPNETSAITFLPDDSVIVLGINGSLALFSSITGGELVSPYKIATSSPKSHLGHKEMPKYIFQEIFTRGLKKIGVSKKHYRHITRRFFGKNVAAKNVPAILSSNDILIACQDHHAINTTFFRINYAHGSLNLIAAIEIGPGCDTSPTVSQDESLAFIIDKNAILYAIDLQTNAIAWTTQLPNASSASPNITFDNLLYISVKTGIICLQVHRDRSELIWHKNFTELANQSNYPLCYINSVLSVTKKYIYAIGAYGKQRLGGFVPIEHYLFILDRHNGHCRKKIPLTHESFCTLSVMPNGNLLIPSKPFYLGITRVLSVKSYLPFTQKKDFHGLTIMAKKDF